jgi:hypothetical protein
MFEICFINRIRLGMNVENSYDVETGREKKI